MFAGRRRRSSTIRVMQLFHELKQQFPTVPDHVVSACISNYAQTPNTDTTIREILEAAAAQSNIQEQMGRSPPQPQSPTLDPLQQQFPPSTSESSSPESNFAEDSTRPSTKNEATSERNRVEMNEGVSDFNRNIVKSGVTYSKKSDSVSVTTSEECCENKQGQSSFFVKRPTFLNVTSETCSDFNKLNINDRKLHNIQPSEKCRDVHKLLNSDHVSDKPPRSPLSAKRFPPKSDQNIRSPLVSPDIQRRLQTNTPPPIERKETVSTPTQTTDTLIGGNVNLSLNVNCSVDVVRSPTIPKHTSVLQMTPTQPWLQEPVSPKSYTSVNLTLRPPSSEPQAPIDITSQNSSLTYSTSSFDSQKGLQSRLQITVGPGGGSVSSVRARPRSCYQLQDNVNSLNMVPARAGSLNDLAVPSTPPVILKQQACIERLRIELTTNKARLVVMQKEVKEMERKNEKKKAQRTDREIEKQLEMEIKHLRCQCEQLALAENPKVSEEFYQNIYTGQRGPITSQIPSQSRHHRSNRERLYYQGPQMLPHPEMEGPKWNCHICTFLNHPDLDKCEQCEMPRILHGITTDSPHRRHFGVKSVKHYKNNLISKLSAPNVRRSHSAANVPLNNNSNPVNNNEVADLNNMPPRPIGFVYDAQQPQSDWGGNYNGYMYRQSASAPNIFVPPNYNNYLNNAPNNRSNNSQNRS